MHWPIDFDSPALTLGLALAAGMVAQALGRHLRIPGIVALLGAGVLLGPDTLDVIRPGELGDLLPMLIGFAVAVILFEGGMNLDIKRLRHSATSIRRLITIGAVVTWLGGAVAARFLMGWSWQVSLLFGSLVIVTGPTVIAPLLRRLNLRRRVATILEAEGVLIDAVGAITAVVTLEVVITAADFSSGVADLLLRLGFGSVVGVAFGLLTAGLLRWHHLVPDGLENMLTLAFVLAVFQLSDSVMHESGIVAVTIAGIVVGNVKTRVLEDLREFKEQLTVLLIGMLFVLLAADVRIAEIADLGWRGAATVAALMLIVRPLNIAVSTLGTEVSPKERLFLSWMAPRGIVAAAVASLFAQQLASQGIAEASQLRALVFLVIAATVLIQGLTGTPLARWLGLRRPTNSGYAILGATPLGFELGRLLQSPEHDVLFLDSSPRACHRAEELGFRVLFGNALGEGLLQRAQLDSRAAAIALTANEEVNFLFASHAVEEYGARSAYVALRRGHDTVSPAMLHRLGAKLLFGSPRTIDLWSVRLEKGEARVETWRARVPVSFGPHAQRASIGNRDLALPLAYRRGEICRPIDEGTKLKPGDTLFVAVMVSQRSAAVEGLAAEGLDPLA
jgi:NhaP-type Na+/H+ or K+/H+ antiporter